MTKTHISGRPVLDTAKRTIKYVRYELQTDGIVHSGGAAGNATDADMTTLRHALTAPGGVLVYEDKGFGDLVVNRTDAPVRDVEWGPIPELLDYSPVGNNLGAKVTWRCSTCIPDQADSKYQRLPMEFWYDVSYDVDEDGYSVVSTNGQVVIPMTRKVVNDSKVVDTADRLREKIRYAEPVGFKRMVQRWKLSADKRTLNFSITDTELPVALPPGCSRCDIRHSVGSEFMKSNNAFVNFRGRIGGQITMARGIPKAESLRKFMAILNKLIGKEQHPAIGLIGGGAAHTALAEPLKVVTTHGKKGTLILTSFEIDNEVFGRSCNYNVTYEIQGCKLENFLPISGLFKSVGTDYKKMNEALADSSGHVRGFAKLKHQSNLDRIIDLTLNIGNTDIVIGVTGKTPGEPTGGMQEAQFTAGIDPDTSWLMFKNALKVLENTGRVHHVPIGKDIKEKPQPDPSVLEQINGKLTTFVINAGKHIGSALPVGVPKLALAAITKTASVMQNTHPPIYKVLMVGVAKRLGYKITPPEVKTIGGVKPHMGERSVVLGETGSIGGIPIFQCVWQIEYFLSKQPTDAELQAPANPEAQIET
jgi:hypothetical protein